MPIGTPSVPYRLPGSQMERWVDIYTRLGVERILFLGSEVNDGIANSLVAQMLYLDSEDSSKPIYLYINSPGGSVTAGLAIYDTIQCEERGGDHLRGPGRLHGRIPAGSRHQRQASGASPQPDHDSPAAGGHQSPSGQRHRN